MQRAWIHDPRQTDHVVAGDMGVPVQKDVDLRAEETLDLVEKVAVGDADSHHAAHGLHLDDRRGVHDLDPEEFGVAPQAAGIVAVAEHDRRLESGEVVEHRLASNVAEVDDPAGAARPKQLDRAARARGVAVGVGEDAQSLGQGEPSWNGTNDEFARNDDSSW